MVSVISLNADSAPIYKPRPLSFRNSRQWEACGVSDVDRDQLPESRPLMLQQLCLLRPHIPAGQTHFALITCADLKSREPHSYLIFFHVFLFGRGHIWKNTRMVVEKGQELQESTMTWGCLTPIIKEQCLNQRRVMGYYTTVRSLHVVPNFLLHSCLYYSSKKTVREITVLYLEIYKAILPC